MPCDDKLFLSCTDPLLFDFHLEPLHPGLHLFIHHHRVDPSVQGDFFGLERPICTQDSCSGWWLALHLGFVSSNHSKPLLPPFDRLAHLCLFQCSWGRLFQELNSFRKRVYKYKFEASYRSKSVCPLLQQIHIQLSASTGYLPSPLLVFQRIRNALHQTKKPVFPASLQTWLPWLPSWHHLTGNRQSALLWTLSFPENYFLHRDIQEQNIYNSKNNNNRLHTATSSLVGLDLAPISSTVGLFSFPFSLSADLFKL